MFRVFSALHYMRYAEVSSDNMEPVVSQEQIISDYLLESLNVQGELRRELAQLAISLQLPENDRVLAGLTELVAEIELAEKRMQQSPAVPARAELCIHFF